MIILNVCSFALTASAMFGFIHESIRQLMLRRYGEEFWTSVLARSGFEAGKENIVNHYYPDSDTYALVDSVSALSKMPREEVWCMYGAFLIEYTMEIGWDELLRTLSPNLKGFLDNLDSLHHFIDESIYKVSLRGPSFRTEQNEDDSITLHYFTGRPGLYPIVKGVLREVAKRVFKTDIVVTVTGRTQRSVQMSTGERIEEHVTLLIREVIVKTDGGNTLSTISNVEQKMICENAVFRVSHNDFLSAFPYHFIIDRDCKIVQAGKSLFKHIPTEFLEPGTPLIRIFEITRPRIPLDFDNICNFINAVFVLQVKSTPSNIQRNIHQRGSDADGHAADSVSNQLLKLKGQMLLLSSKNHVIYLCSPYVTSIPELLMYGMRLNAMPLHDATRDLILLNQQRLSDVEVNFQLEANNEQLEQMAKDLEFEKGKTDALLKEMLPASVASQLINGETVDAKEYDEATVMFCDIPSFASNIILCGPKVIVFLLNELFTKFDALVVKNEVYKVETVTDSYLTVGGIPDRDENHCERICHLALGMIYTSRTVMDPSNNKPLQVRCGVNTGPVVAGVIGAKMPRYCLFGDTVNTASRMESHSPASRIHCSQSTFESANTTGRFEFQSRGKISIKGKGEMETYFLKKSFKKSIWEIIGQSRDENLHSIDGYQELHDGEQEEHLIGVSQITSKIHSKSCSLQ